MALMNDFHLLVHRMSSLDVEVFKDDYIAPCDIAVKNFVMPSESLGVNN